MTHAENVFPDLPDYHIFMRDEFRAFICPSGEVVPIFSMENEELFRHIATWNFPICSHLLSQ